MIYNTKTKESALKVKQIAEQILAITSGKLSCGNCNLTVKVEECKEEESEVKDSVFNNYKLAYICPKCDKEICGAVV